MPRSTILLLLVLAAGVSALASGCASDSFTDRYGMTAASTDTDLTAKAGEVAPMDPTRTITDRDCSRPIDQPSGGNLNCQ